MAPTTTRYYAKSICHLSLSDTCTLSLPMHASISSLGLSMFCIMRNRSEQKFLPQRSQSTVIDGRDSIRPVSRQSIDFSSFIYSFISTMQPSLHNSTCKTITCSRKIDRQHDTNYCETFPIGQQVSGHVARQYFFKQYY